MIAILLAVGLTLMLLERLFPDQTLPKVATWWIRGIIVNIFQLGVVMLGVYTWDLWLQGVSLFSLSDSLSPALAALLVYFFITFVFYWWHRFRHDSYLIWLLVHQFHHSPARVETITTFYKHPLEMIIDGIIIAIINCTLFGLDIAAVAFVTLFTGLVQLFSHMNIKTPHFVGYFFQRPEMHRIHHKRSYHYQNFSDLPLWDMLFGTFYNPKTYQGLCGYKTGREQRVFDMLCFRDVNNKTSFKKK
ncbi:sterol desaturase family protein [Endozoicomonas sp.]|uniref:sterol desaturase family protein n=1 Tax=Endozoicomonas sp. TaxID=1892382 RepID=UPI002885E765|nr:sterol desaturase family protein [Endozoicomonas sp.]